METHLERNKQTSTPSLETRTSHLMMALLINYEGINTSRESYVGKVRLQKMKIFA